MRIQEGDKTSIGISKADVEDVDKLRQVEKTLTPKKRTNLGRYKQMPEHLLY